LWQTLPLVREQSIRPAALDNSQPRVAGQPKSLVITRQFFGVKKQNPDASEDFGDDSLVVVGALKGRRSMNFIGGPSGPGRSSWHSANPA
jgi:hypothetical protein